MCGRVIGGLVAVVVAAVAGCGGQKSTAELVGDLKSHSDKDRIVAARLLGHNNRDAAQAVPALTAALKDHDPDVRRSAAIGLGGYGAEARDAVTALQAALKDADARVRESVGQALHRIDPARFAAPSRGPKGR